MSKLGKKRQRSRPKLSHAVIAMACDLVRESIRAALERRNDGRLREGDMIVLTYNLNFALKKGAFNSTAIAERSDD